MKTPLCIACEHGNITMVKYLVEHGADIHAHYEPIDLVKYMKSKYNYYSKISSFYQYIFEKEKEGLIKARIENGNDINNIHMEEGPLYFYSSIDVNCLERKIPLMEQKEKKNNDSFKYCSSRTDRIYTQLFTGKGN